VPINQSLNQSTDPWDWWDRFRSNSNTEKRLNLALVLDGDVPDQQRLKRWLGEPIKCLVIATSLFLVNKKGYPVLPRSVQTTVKAFLPLRVQFVIEGQLLSRPRNIII
jgi:protein arginine N-methyltransferase 5